MNDVSELPRTDHSKASELEKVSVGETDSVSTRTGKNIVLCCDGTNNQFSGDHTNVIRTYKVARKDPRQFTFYDCGVGTMPEPWHEGRLAKRWALLKGLTFGSGFMKNIEDAYRYLMTAYQNGDRIFIFGFSRGAYTARALAGMLKAVGLLHPGTENLIPYAQRYWLKDFGKDSPGGVICEEFRSTLSRSCPVHFIGVWDTVGSVGMINQFRTFPHTYTNDQVTHVRHAVSLDERRSCFRQNLMAAVNETQDVKNVWFAGVHSDVGGGYPAAEGGLAKISFQWMMREAEACGMEIDSAALHHEIFAVGAPPDALAEQHESLKGGWQIVELIPVRRYNWASRKHEWQWPLGSRRNSLRDAKKREVLLHQSVLLRLKGGRYNPLGFLPGEFNIES
jgi:uncharacterized protein (DUF2235 family)